MNVTDRMILTITIIGIALTITFQPSCISSINEVTRDSVGERYCGPLSVGSVSHTSDVTFITPRERSDIEAIMFTKRNVTVNTTYTVHGQVDMYHGQLEIVVDRLQDPDDP